MNFDIDIAIVVGFLILTLVAGLYYGRGVRTVEDYALGGRNFSTEALVSTIVATVGTGSLFVVGVLRTYTHGLYDLIPTCGMALSFLLLAYILIPRMSEFLGSISVAESMGKLYGKNVRLITALSGAIGATGVAVQYRVFGDLLNYFLNLNSTYVILVSGFIVTVYSAFGGIRSVTFTDILQFITFGIAIPLLGILIWSKLNTTGSFSLTKAFSSRIFNYKEVFDFYSIEFWSMLMLFIYFSMPLLHPAFFQRIIIGKDIQQVKRAFSISAVILFVLIILIAWIPFLIFNDNPSLEPNQLLGYIIDNYTYAGFKGFIIAGIMAMAMSSADSFINSASVLFAHDFCKPLGIFNNNELLVTRVFACILGVMSALLALSDRDLLGIILFANSFYMPIVTIPLLLAILGFRTSTKSVLIGMGAGFTTVMIWKILGINFDDIVPAMLMNLVFTMGSHYILKQQGGWVNTKKLLEEKKQESLFSKMKNFNLIEFLKANTPNDNKSYTLFGIFCFISTVSTIYLTHDYTMSKHFNILLYIDQLMLVVSCFFMFYLMWSPKLKHPLFLSIVWHISLVFMLSFYSSFFLLLSNFGTVQLVIFTLNLMVLFNLSKWKNALGIIFIGFPLSMQVYRQYSGAETVELTLGHGYIDFIYVILLVITALIAFLKPKQEYQEATEAKVGTLETEITDLSEKVTHYTERISDQGKEIERLGATAQKILNNVNHELRLPVGNVMNFAEMLNDGLEKLNKNQLKMLSDEVYKNSNRLSSMIMNMLDLATLKAKKIELSKSMINFGELVRDRVQLCRKMYLGKKHIDFEMSIEENVFVNVDPNYMRQTVDNLVINAINFSTQGVIRISALRKGNFVEFIIEDDGIGIPREELYDIFTPFKMGSNTASKAEGRGVGLALCKAALEAHGGSITAESKGGKGARFRFLI